MAKQISLSFKEDETELYNFIKSKLSPSIYVKELVEKDMKHTMNNTVNLSALKSIGR